MITNGKRIMSMQLLRMAIAAALVATVALIGLNAAAQTAGTSEAANTLRVSPVRSDVTINPGEQRTIPVTITNPTAQTVAVRVIQNDFVAGDENGTPSIILDETEYAPSHSLKRFLTPIEELTLEPNEARVVNVEITVPENAEAGGYFGAIRFAPTSPDEGGQVNLSASVASLILLTVAGDAPERLDLTEFAIQQDGRSKTFFATGEGISATARFQNEGNLQAGPFGKVSVTKGNEVVHEIDFNNKTQRDMVLPDSARRWNIPLEGVEGFGRYTVSATFTYGANNQTIEVTESFWVIPKTILIAAIVGLLLIVAVIVGVVMSRRRKARSRRSFGGKR